MKDELFKKIEKQLFKYYEDSHVLEVKRISNNSLKAQYENIESILRSNNYSLSIDLGYPSIDERVQTSNTGVSKVESDMYRQAEKLLEEQKEIDEQIFKNEQLIRSIERRNIEIKANIDGLNEESRRLVEMKYKKKLSAIKIASKLNMTERSYYDLRIKVIENIARWSELKGDDL